MELIWSIVTHNSAKHYLNNSFFGTVMTLFNLILLCCHDYVMMSNSNTFLKYSCYFYRILEDNSPICIVNCLLETIYMPLMAWYFRKRNLEARPLFIQNKQLQSSCKVCLHLICYLLVVYREQMTHAAIFIPSFLPMPKFYASLSMASNSCFFFVPSCSIIPHKHSHTSSDLT